MLNIYNFKKISNYSVINKIPEITRGGTIFCRGKYIDELLTRIKDLPFKFTLITYMSDVNLSEDIYNLRSKNIKNWFSDNVSCVGPKVFPLGIPATLKSEGFSSECNIKRINVSSPKENLSYFGMNENKNIERLNVFNQVKSFSLCTNNVNQFDYYKNISKSRFTFCPAGYGADTWRFFEALYLKSIPVMRKNIISDYWSRYFSIFQYNDISEITKNALLKFNKNKYTPEILSFNFWAKKIKECHDGSTT